MDAGSVRIRSLQQSGGGSTVGGDDGGGGGGGRGGGGGQRSAARACELTMEARMLRALARTSATLAAMRRLVVAAAARVGRPAARSEPWMAPRQAARSAASVGHVSLSMPKLSSSCQAP